MPVPLSVLGWPELFSVFISLGVQYRDNPGSSPGKIPRGQTPGQKGKNKKPRKVDFDGNPENLSDFPITTLHGLSISVTMTRRQLGTRLRLVQCKIKNVKGKIQEFLQLLSPSSLLSFSFPILHFLFCTLHYLLDIPRPPRKPALRGRTTCR